MIVSVMFFAKICILALYYIIAQRFFIVYLMLLVGKKIANFLEKLRKVKFGFNNIVSWLVLKIPVNRGPHNFIDIEDEEHFDEYVLGWVRN